MAKENHLKLKTRRNIYYYILKHPGNHYSGISKILNIHKNTISYHLDYLVEQGLVTEQSENGYKRYYSAKLDGEKAYAVAKILTEKIPYETISRVYRILAGMSPGVRDREVIGLLKQDTCCQIVRFLLLHPNSTQMKISKFLNKHHSTVSFYLKKLVEKDIVLCVSNGKGLRYGIKDEEYIVLLFRFYFGVRERLNADGDPTGVTEYFMLDSILERLTDILPCPFCAGFSIC